MFPVACPAVKTKAYIGTLKIIMGLLLVATTTPDPLDPSGDIILHTL